MKKAILALIVLTAVLGMVHQPRVSAQQPAIPAYTVEMEMQPVESTEGMYSCRITVSNGDTVLAAPRIKLESGSEGQARSTNPKTGEVIDVTVVPDGEGNSLAYSVEVRSGGGLLIARHRASVRL